MQKQKKCGKLRDTKNKLECLSVSWILAVVHPDLCWRGAPRAQEELDDIHRLTRADAGARSLARASRSACIPLSLPTCTLQLGWPGGCCLVLPAGLCSARRAVEDGELCFVFRSFLRMLSALGCRTPGGFVWLVKGPESEWGVRRDFLPSVCLFTYLN